MAGALEAMTRLSGAAKWSGEARVGRVLRPRASKLVDSNITFKVTKGAKVAVDKEEEAKPKTKREAAGAVTEQVKKPRKKSTTKTKTIVTISTEVGVDQGIGADSSKLGSVEKVVTVSSSSTWSVSLSTPEAIAEATKHLVAADTKLADIIGVHGVCPVWNHKGDCFSALARSIVYQQLSGKAATTIFTRLEALCGGPESMTATRVAALTAEELRAVGVSGRKASYLHDLAAKFTSGALADETLVVMGEDNLVAALTAVKGIGVWSAHMFMIFYLHKPDVLPVGDLAIRKGFQKLFGLQQQPPPAEMQELALSWRPYRTLASWYLWRMADVKLPEP